ncbi:helix-hairpin-helix domain-containing protein [Arthrobacter sp. Sa2CUA1]|uniref:Helix-hairpin-helix domain-containing protein n=1 Tax=Arthrobacter gallicola TaxID=2762225 RepID=A0ABR8UW14_9MICC|nr:helix-hairpin-helix domain-containing protein [Arthrobacter gallicola]MBD7996745.1 helix-hairpin-helix domain-containing protein [Arthrobacter gallicola]
MSAAPADSVPGYPGYGWMLRRSLWILAPILSMGLLTGPVLLLLGWRAKASNLLWPGAVYTGAAAVSFLMNEDAGPILRTLIWILGTMHCLIMTPAWLRESWWAAPVPAPRKTRTESARVSDQGAGTPPASGLAGPPGSPADLLLSDPGIQAAAYYAGASRDGGSGGAGSGAGSAGAPHPGAAVGALLLNVNAASERDLRQLPGIGRQRAAQTVRLRMQEGPFLSLEDYGQRLNLGPQVTDRLRGRVRFGDGPGRSSASGFGRKVDY